MKKRIAAMVMTVLFFVQSMTCVFVGASSVTDSLNDSQRYVYELVHTISDNECSMLRVVQDDNYFDKMETNGLLDIFRHTWDAFRGSDTYMQSYFNTVIVDAITISEADINYSEVDRWNSAFDIFVDNLSDAHLLPKYTKILQAVKNGGIEAQKGILYLKKAGASTDCYVHALDLVQSYTNDTNIQSTSNKIYKLMTSPEMDAKFQYWTEYLADEGIQLTGDAILSVITKSLWKYVSLLVDIAAGDIIDANLSELHMTMFQSAVYNTFFEKLYSKGNNYLQNEYTEEDLFDLLCLAELYLKAGYVGFQYNSYSNANTCADKLHYLENLTPPNNVGEAAQYKTCPVSITNYSVPGILAQGDKYACFGEIVSDQVLQKVCVDIVGSSNSEHYSADNINSNTFNIASIDNQIMINYLQPDNYHYIVKAYTQDQEYILLDEVFDVIPEDGNMTINQYHVPGRISKGSVFIVSGLIKSASPLSKVRVEILDREGNWKTGDEESDMNTTEYNINRLDANTRFDQLDYGQFRYRIIASNSSGTEVLVDQPFQVY